MCCNLCISILKKQIHLWQFCQCRRESPEKVQRSRQEDQLLVDQKNGDHQAIKGHSLKYDFSSRKSRASESKPLKVPSTFQKGRPGKLYKLIKVLCKRWTCKKALFDQAPTLLASVLDWASQGQLSSHSHQFVAYLLSFLWLKPQNPQHP